MMMLTMLPKTFPIYYSRTFATLNYHRWPWLSGGGDGAAVSVVDVDAEFPLVRP